MGRMVLFTRQLNNEDKQITSQFFRELGHLRGFWDLKSFKDGPATVALKALTRESLFIEQMADPSNYRLKQLRCEMRAYDFHRFKMALLSKMIRVYRFVGKRCTGKILCIFNCVMKFGFSDHARLTPVQKENLCDYASNKSTLINRRIRESYGIKRTRDAWFIEEICETIK